jgi:hypothetical protein
MLHILHAESQIQSFLSFHRFDEGGMIHHCHDIKADNLSLRYLVVFLRHKHTDTVTFSLIE